MRLPAVHPFLHDLLRQDTGTLHLPLAPDDPVWDAILRDASEQSLIALLYQRSQEARQKYRFPPSVHNRLKSEMARLAAQSMVLTAELTAILNRCRDRGLPCIPFRGLALAKQLYGEASPRPTGDIDLLVRRQDLPAITDTLTGLGYESMEHQPGFARTFSYTLEFIKNRHGWLVVEPHWTLAYPPFADALDMEQVWNRRRKGRVAGIDTWLLSHEDLLVHLCFHILHQGGNAPLLWWYELDLLIRQTGASLNWGMVTRVAEQAGQPFFVAEVLRALHERFQTPVPQSALTRLSVQPSASPATNLLMTAPRLNGREEFAQFISLPDFHAKARYALGLLFPSPAYMVRRYGTRTRARLGIAYLTRMLSLGWEGLRWSFTLLSTAFSTKVSLPR